MRSCNLNVTDSNQPIFALNNRGQVLDMTVQRDVPLFLLGAICGYSLQLLVVFQPRRIDAGMHSLLVIAA